MRPHGGSQTKRLFSLSDLSCVPLKPWDRPDGDEASSALEWCFSLSWILKAPR